MVTISFSVYGDKQVERTLLRFKDRADNLSAVWPRVGDYLRHAERAQFDSEGATGSGGWKPLKASTLRHKATSGLDPRILRSSGALMRSLTEKSAPGSSEQSSDDTYFFGSSVGYARWHQMGTRRMPQRKPIELSETNRRDIVKIVQDFLMDPGR